MLCSDFINKEYLQKGGDILRVLEIFDKTIKDGHPYFKCLSLKYNNIVYALKTNILQGKVLNPKIEQIEFWDKIWSQNCGDSLRVLEKDISLYKKGSSAFYICEFIKYPSKVSARKGEIVSGQVDNSALPWKTKESLQDYILNNFDKKPSLDEIAEALGVCKPLICRNILKFELRDLVNYYCNISKGEKELKDFISNYLEIEVSNTWDELVSSKNCELEIDIYIPNLKLGFEYDGNYWHSELFNGYNRKIEKDNLASKKGIKLIHIFEEDWKNNKEQLKNFIIQEIEQRKKLC